MSGIAGIVRFDGGSIEPGQIERMVSAMAHRGPDGIDCCARGSVAFGHCMLRTTPESLEETQPLTNEDQSLVLVMDGRIDNWEELRGKLLTQNARLRTRADPELVLRAYEFWGQDCLDHIDGDFAFVIWDARRREAFCARDRMGANPFYYHWDGRRFAFASELHAILSLPWISEELNEGMLAEIISWEEISRDETLWKGIYRLVAARRMLVTSEGTQMQHLALLGRLLLIEQADGPTDIRDATLGDWIDSTQQPDGIGNLDFEKEPSAQSLLRTLNLFHEIFKDDSALDDSGGMKELTIEYFIISMVMLVRRLRKYYVFGKELYPVFRKFVYEFHNRWRTHSEDDRDILVFADNRQQGQADLETRDRMLRLAFFEFLEREKVELKTLDSKRLFNEAERIRIYRRQDGLCQMCLAEKLPPEEARVSWSQYQADHILPWIKGGQTAEWNAQVLCMAHNASKGGK